MLAMNREIEKGKGGGDRGYKVNIALQHLPRSTTLCACAFARFRCGLREVFGELILPFVKWCNVDISYLPTLPTYICIIHMSGR